MKMNFIAQFVALVTGDDAKAQALKIQRKASAAVQAQISSLQGDTIDKEEAVIEAKEALAAAIVNRGSESFDRGSYVTNLLFARNRVVEAEKAYTTHVAKLEFLEETLETIKTGSVEDIVYAVEEAAASEE